MPPSAQVSIEAAGRYLATAVPDLGERAKAVHDFVVLRLTYDHATAAAIEVGSHDHPPQDAASVFAARTGVCEGYARLMVEVGKAAGVDVAFIGGYARQPLDGRVVPRGGEQAALAGSEHAWNAVRIAGTWYLVDATWDDGGDQYATTYLFTPPDLFVEDHLPDQSAWQLVAEPRSTAEFVRAPAVNPRLAAFGLTLESPTRSQVGVSGTAEVLLRNPRGAAVAATISPGDADPNDTGKRRDCDVAPAAGGRTVVTCGGLATGQYRLIVFAGPHGVVLHDVASVWVNSR